LYQFLLDLQNGFVQLLLRVLIISLLLEVEAVVAQIGMVEMVEVVAQVDY
jgi:hypothetical protein